MSEVWRICVIEDEEALNQHLVNALRKDGHTVQGVTREADAVHVLWSQEFDIVIYDLKAPEDGSLELLQWLRVSRPNLHMITIGSANSLALRTQVLEIGAVSYLEKPLDLRVLKNELRRLAQNSGFTASLDSFDLLDVVQIINMSRKSITLLINTGLEEYGTLGFQNGELIWAEYGTLRSEEAFFALAAHKNGTVTQQSLDEQMVANITQPLSRLIFQALQYRTKYADRQPEGSDQEEQFASNALVAFSVEDVDDRPFVFSPEEQIAVPATPILNMPVDLLQPTFQLEVVEDQIENIDKEWWQRTGQLQRVTGVLDAAMVPTSAMGALTNETGQATSDDPSDPPTNNVLVELPSWLTDQPTSQSIPAIQPSAFAYPEMPAVSISPDSDFFDALQDSNPLLSTPSLKQNNYAALVSALHTLGYSIVGFIAAAVVSTDGQPVAQVAVDELDISHMCGYFSAIQKNTLQALSDPQEGDYEEIVITSSTRHILMRSVDRDQQAFLVLMTTREASPAESLEVMANVEGAISAALR
jgi:CheY-like chemotaxis protein/predicted regulator of Ras-like GTPase activity (Roadblock/LC7/MglB family)